MIKEGFGNFARIRDLIWPLILISELKKQGPAQTFDMKSFETIINSPKLLMQNSPP